MIAVQGSGLPYSPLVALDYTQYSGPLWSASESSSVGYANAFTQEYHEPPNTPTITRTHVSVPAWKYPWSSSCAAGGYEGWLNAAINGTQQWMENGIPVWEIGSGHIDAPLGGPSLTPLAIEVERHASVWTLIGGLDYNVVKRYYYEDYLFDYSRFDYDYASSTQDAFYSHTETYSDVTNVLGFVTSTLPLTDLSVRRMMSDQNVEDFDVVSFYASAISSGKIIEATMPHMSVIFLCNPEGTGPDLSRSIVWNVKPQAGGLPQPGTFHTPNPEATITNYSCSFNGTYTNYFYHQYYDAVTNLHYTEGGIITNGGYNFNPSLGTIGPISGVVENFSHSAEESSLAARNVRWHGDYAYLAPNGPANVRIPLIEASWGPNVSGWQLSQSTISDAWVVTFTLTEYTGNILDGPLDLHVQIDIVPGSAIAVSSLP